MKSASFNSVQPTSMARSTLVLSTNISSNISSSMTTTTQSTKSPFMVRSTPVTSAQTSILSMTSSSTTSQSKGTATTSRPTPATSSKPTTVATTNRQSKTTIYTTPQSTSLRPTSTSRPTLVSFPRQSTATTTSRPATVTMTSRLISLTTNQPSSTKAQSKVSQTPTVSTSTARSSTQPSLSPSTTATSASQATTTTGGTTVVSIPQSTMQSSQLGNTGLCSSSVVQYVKSDNELLAQLGDSCYTLVPHRASWSHAESVCSQRGGHLFHIANQNQNNFFYNLLSDHFYNHSVWLGLHDIVREGHFQWTSSDPVNFTNWALGRNGRFNNHFVEDCVVFLPYWNHGQWDDVQCGATSPDYEQVQENHYFICQFRIENVVPVNPIKTGTHQSCPSNVVNDVNREGGQLTRYGERCYERVPQPRTWDAAEQDCRNKGGHLVHIGSSKEENDIQEFLRQFGGARFAVWIELNDQAYEGVYVWSSGERLTYTNWLVGQLNHHGLEDCVLLVPYNYGGWDDVPCGQYYVDHPVLGRQFHTEIHPYICEYHVVTAGSPVLVGK